MKFPYSLAAIDLDDTLLGPDHLISTRNANAIRALLEQGVTCVIASGRMHEATTRFADQLGLESPIISYNGAMVKRPHSGEVWRHVRLDAAPAAEVIAFCAEHGHHLNLYLDDHLYVAARTDWAEFYLRQTGSPMEVVGDLRRFAGSRPTKLILIDAPEVTDGLLPVFRERFGSGVYITKTNPEYLEFMNPEASKGAALEMVANRLGIARERVIAFGDGNNDIPMLKWAGRGVAMGTAKEHVRAIADDVAPPYDEDGLGIFIERMLEQ
jgi:Cof subfamily protein (haloacid dehalogenase superfamily)